MLWRESLTTVPMAGCAAAMALPSPYIPRDSLVGGDTKHTRGCRTRPATDYGELSLVRAYAA